MFSYETGQGFPAGAVMNVLLRAIGIR